VLHGRDVRDEREVAVVWGVKKWAKEEVGCDAVWDLKRACDGESELRLGSEVFGVVWHCVAEGRSAGESVGRWWRISLPSFRW